MKHKTTFVRSMLISFVLFAISSVTAQVTAPNGAENWEEGSSQTIAWNTVLFTTNIDIHYDNGGGWTLVQANILNDGTELWTVPNTPSTNVVVRIQETGGGGSSDQSDAVFTIAGITAVTSPTAGDSWAEGSSQTITWTTIGTIASSTIEYYNGSGWTTLTTTASGNSYTWSPVNNTPTTSASVRISNTAGASTAQSAGAFTITGINAVTSPNGGENWEEGTSQTITWTTIGTIASSTIEYFNGSGWTTLTTTASGNSYTWNSVNNTSTTGALVRVTNSAGTSTDQSDATFTIAGINAVTSPNGAENWEEGSSQTITWTTIGTIASSTIEYYNGSGWTSLTTTGTGNSYSWNPVNNTPTAVALVRVSNSAGASTDQSNAVFTIAGINLVTSPNGGEIWQVGSSKTITWTTIGTVANSKIDYYNGSGWTTLTTAGTGNSYTWNPVNDTPTAVALVRVTNNSGLSTDQSDATFTIYRPKLGIPTLTAPIDQATLVSLNPIFSWIQHLDGTNIFENDEFYELVISTDQWFANITYSNTSIITGGANTQFDMSTVLQSLALNTKYYWRIRAKATSFTPTLLSPWSSTFTFTTTSSVVKPTQTFPIGGNTVYTNTPTFYWYTGVVSSNQFFEVWYGEASSVTAADNAWATNTDPTGGGATGNYVAPGTVGTTTNYTIPGGSALTSNTDYRWWVRTTDGINFSDWSDMGTFHTSSTNGGPVQPVGTYPTLGESQYTNNPYLYWYIVTQVTGLQFEVVYGTDNTQPSIATPVPVMTGDQQHVAFATVGTNYFYQLSGLVSSTTYYWWVRSTDGANYSAWSPVYTFSTTATTGSPVKPVLTYPANGETVYYSDVSLHWYATTIATNLKYDLYWSTSNTAPTGGTTPSESGITNLYTTVNGLTANTTYYWWVRSTDNAGLNPSVWSDIGTFVASESAAQVKVPVPMYPTGSITVTGTSVDLSWAYNGSMAGITFAARYSLYPDMTLPTTITLTVPTSTTHTWSGLATGTTYYWQVQATNGTLTSAWSTASQFSTWASSSAPIVVPMVGSPIASAVVDTDSPELSWFLPTQSDGLTYELQYSFKGDFSDAKEITNITGNKVTLTDVQSGEKNYWRVRSKDNSGNFSIYSAIGTFVGQSVTAIEEESIIPEKFEVSQNYPNPFNPSTVIKYSLPEAEFVTLRIYNMLGQEVATLINNDVNAGIHYVTWNAIDNSGAKVSTGTYIYRVVAGNNILTKKMILLK